MYRTPTRLFALTLATVLAASLASANPAAAQDLKQLAESGRQAVVMLQVTSGSGREIGQGTGFFVADGVIATTHHVVAKAAQSRAVLEDGREIPVEGVLAWDEDHDLALVSVSMSPAEGGYESLKLARTPADLGDEIVVVGNPMGLSHTLSTGVVAAVREAEERSLFEGEVIQITAAISSGSSGSPVMNLAGEVVGVVTSQFVYGQNLNFAVPVEHLQRLLRTAESSGGLERAFGTASTDPDRRFEREFQQGEGFARLAYARNLVISLLVFGAVYWGYRRLR